METTITYGSCLSPVHAWYKNGMGSYTSVCDPRLSARILREAHTERREGVKYCPECLRRLEGKQP
jgi:hypothetical protein